MLEPGIHCNFALVVAVIVVVAVFGLGKVWMLEFLKTAHWRSFRKTWMNYLDECRKDDR